MPGRSGRASELRYLTVVSYGRSGSTAIQASLNALPGVLVRGENYSAMRGLAEYARAIGAAGDRHHAGRPEHPWFGTAKLDPPAVLADLRRHVVQTVLRPRADTAWIGFKEVRYEPGHFADYEVLLDYLLFLAQLFPGLVYVINTRDPDQAARSGWWSDHPDARSALETSQAWLSQAAADLNAILPGERGHARAAHVRHEQWGSDPQILIDAYAELGLPRDPQAVREALASPLDHGRAT